MLHLGRLHESLELIRSPVLGFRSSHGTHVEIVRRRQQPIYPEHVEMRGCQQSQPNPQTSTLYALYAVIDAVQLGSGAVK